MGEEKGSIFGSLSGARPFQLDLFCFVSHKHTHTHTHTHLTVLLSILLSAPSWESSLVHVMSHPVKKVSLISLRLCQVLNVLKALSAFKSLTVSQSSYSVTFQLIIQFDQ